MARSPIHMAAIVRQARKRGAGVLKISPGGDGNDPLADSYIRIRSGTDRFLAAAVIGLLLEHGLVREDILERTSNWDSFHNVLKEYSIEQLAGICDVTTDDIECAYDYYMNGGPAATIIGAGLQQYKYGGENVRFINAPEISQIKKCATPGHTPLVVSTTAECFDILFYRQI